MPCAVGGLRKNVVLYLRFCSTWGQISRTVWVQFSFNREIKRVLGGQKINNTPANKQQTDWPVPGKSVLGTKGSLYQKWVKGFDVIRVKVCGCFPSATEQVSESKWPQAACLMCGPVATKKGENLCLRWDGAGHLAVRCVFKGLWKLFCSFSRFAQRQRGARRHLALAALHSNDDNCGSPADKPPSKYFSSRMHIY